MFKNSLLEENVNCHLHNERIVTICLKKECELNRSLCYKCIVLNHITNHTEKDFEIYTDYLRAFNVFIENQKNKQERHYINFYKENLVTIIGDYKNKIEQMFDNLTQKIYNESQSLNPYSHLKIEKFNFDCFNEVITFINTNHLSYNKELKSFLPERNDPFENQEKLTEEIRKKKELFELFYMNLKKDFENQFMNQYFFPVYSNPMLIFKNPHHNIIEITNQGNKTYIKKITKYNSHYSVISDKPFPNNHLTKLKVKILRINNVDRFVGFGIIEEKMFTGLSSIYCGYMFWGYGVNRLKGNIPTTVSNDEKGINVGSEFICTYDGLKGFFEIKSYSDPIVSLYCDEIKGKNFSFCINFYYDSEVLIESIY